MGLMVESWVYKVLEVLEYYGWFCYLINDYLINNLSNCYCVMVLDNVVCFFCFYYW